MPFLDIDYNPTTSFDSYLRPAKNSGKGYKKGDLILPIGSKIYFICDSCENEFSIGYRPYVSISSGSLCSLCKQKQTKQSRYGSEGFNNKEKAIKTNLIRYGIVGTPRKGINKGKKFTVEHRRKLSKIARERISPRLGTHNSEESNEKNRQSQFRYLKEHGLNSKGSGKFHSGTFFSEKNNIEMRYRSSYERGFSFLLENFDEISSYTNEELCIPYVDSSGKSRLYFPDFVLHLFNGKKYIVEIKAERFMDDPNVLCKKNSAIQFAINNNYNGYRLLTLGDFHKFIFGELNLTHFTNEYFKWLQLQINKVA